MIAITMLLRSLFEQAVSRGQVGYLVACKTVF